jgi:hypothetical protein
MDIEEIIQSQYFAALAMLKQAIIKCPPSVWDAPQDKDQFWFKAYHTLYYTHKYLQIKTRDFVPWKKHHKPDSQKEPITREDVLEYLAFVEQEVTSRIPLIDLEAGAGFLGNRLSKMELQIINIRHIQEHTGELYERLGSRENTALDWAEQRHNKVNK